jgi:hypothetical protein
MEKKKPYSAPDVEPLALDDDALGAVSGGLTDEERDERRRAQNESARQIEHRAPRTFNSERHASCSPVPDRTFMNAGDPVCQNYT